MSEGDYAAAITAYEALLTREPANAEAVAGRAWAALLQRSADVDPDAALAAAQSAPDDVQAQTAAADAEVLSERIDDAIARLVGYVRRSAGEDRDSARVHLLGLFDALDPEDPRIVTGRRALSNALF
jgi:putative thioredoxin